MMELFMEIWSIIAYFVIFILGFILGHWRGYSEGIKWCNNHFEKQLSALHELSEQDQQTLESIGNEIHSERQD